MKKHYVLEEVEELEFDIFAINSHTKAYKLCWMINKTLEINLEKVNDQQIDKKRFARYQDLSSEGAEYNVVVNQSKEGYLIPDQKKINYFLIINKENNKLKKKDVISRLAKLKEILIIFEVKAEKTQYINRFIFNDKKN
tara:strand:+ start:109 stop:525 length:417 start_codon:yes stop_codon:yes gene_type:complete